MEKRGVSGIVVTVILVGLSISLIAIIWTVIANLVDTNLENAKTSLTQIELNIIDGSVINSSLTEFSLKLDRGYDKSKIVKLIFSIENNEEKIRTKTITTDILLAGEGKTYQFDTSDFSIITDTNDLKEISVTPVIEINGKEKTLKIADTHKFNFEG
jgi:hypothetical protein